MQNILKLKVLFMHYVTFYALCYSDVLTFKQDFNVVGGTSTLYLWASDPVLQSQPIVHCLQVGLIVGNLLNSKFEPLKHNINYGGSCIIPNLCGPYSKGCV